MLADGVTRCPQHQRSHNLRVARAGEPLAGNCLMWMTTNHWCTRHAAEGEIKCQWHIDRHARPGQVAIFFDAFMMQEPRPTWQQVAQAVQRAPELRPQVRYDVAHAFQLETAPNVTLAEFFEFYEWARLEAEGVVMPRPEPRPVGNHMRQLPAAPARPARNQEPTLADIARDNQSVHTAAVSEQTNLGLQKLLAVPVPAGQKTLETFGYMWLRYEKDSNWGDVANTVDDMHAWYIKKMCRKANDKLYMKVLDGLLAYIGKTPSNETKLELFHRTYQECREAVGMCCDGHINRLCNVLVGFDPDFASPVPKGEILQSKMAALAAMEIPTKEKIKQAMDVLRELEIPGTEWEPWIEAMGE